MSSGGGLSPIPNSLTSYVYTNHFTERRLIFDQVEPHGTRPPYDPKSHQRIGCPSRNSHFPTARLGALSIHTLRYQLCPGRGCWGPSSQVRFTRVEERTRSVHDAPARVTNSATHLAKKHRISSFLCLNSEMSPWLPAGPGRHGFMHMDVGKDMELLQDGDTQHVFVGGLGRSSKLQPRYMYCGEYRIARQAPLTLAEWKTLPLQVSMPDTSSFVLELMLMYLLAGANPPCRDRFDQRLDLDEQQRAGCAQRIRHGGAPAQLCAPGVHRVRHGLLPGHVGR